MYFQWTPLRSPKATILGKGRSEFTIVFVQTRGRTNPIVNMGRKTMRSYGCLVDVPFPEDSFGIPEGHDPGHGSHGIVLGAEEPNLR